MALNDEVIKICDVLDSIENAVFEGQSDDLPINRGWNCPALNRYDLSAVAGNLSNRIREAAEDQDLDQDFIDTLVGVDAQLEKLKKQTIPQIYANNGNEAQASAAYLGTMFAVEQLFSPVLKPRWEDFENPDLMPKNLAKRIRGVNAQIGQMEKQVPDLEIKVVQISKAHAAAASLPADLELLEESRERIADCKKGAESDSTDIAKKKTQSEKDVEALSKKLAEAEGLITQLKDLHRVGTSTTLAGAFQAKANELSNTVWWWSAILLGALMGIVVIGCYRVDAVQTAMNLPTVQWEAIWVNVLLTLFSVSAPVWLAWVATKQIAQRFRLAEDYAYKASISNAYEGYRREAVALDESFQNRLFDSALTRLDEVPGRLVDPETHGSPLHELMESEAVKKAFGQIPGFVQEVKDLAAARLGTLRLVSSRKEDVKKAGSEAPALVDRHGEVDS